MEKLKVTQRIKGKARVGRVQSGSQASSSTTIFVSSYWSHNHYIPLQCLKEKSRSPPHEKEGLRVFTLWISDRPFYFNPSVQTEQIGNFPTCTQASGYRLHLQGSYPHDPSFSNHTKTGFTRAGDTSLFLGKTQPSFFNSIVLFSELFHPRLVEYILGLTRQAGSQQGGTLAFQTLFFFCWL